MSVYPELTAPPFRPRVGKKERPCRRLAAPEPTSCVSRSSQPRGWRSRAPQARRRPRTQRPWRRSAVLRPSGPTRAPTRRCPICPRPRGSATHRYRKQSRSRSRGRGSRPAPCRRCAPITAPSVSGCAAALRTQPSTLRACRSPMIRRRRPSRRRRTGMNGRSGGKSPRTKILSNRWGSNSATSR